MSQHAFDETTADRDDQPDERGPVLAPAPDVVEVRRNGGLAALVGATASALAIAYLSRAARTGSVLDWALVAAMGLLAAAHLRSLVDARTPLLVADGQGVRIRLGRAWHGLPWGALAEIEHTPRRGLLRDGRLVLVPHNTERVLSELDAAGLRQSRLSERLYGAPLALPLGLSTRVAGPEQDLTLALRELAGTSASVVELVGDVPEDVVPDVEIVEPEEPRRGRGRPDPRPRLRHLAAVVARLLARGDHPDAAPDAVSEAVPDAVPDEMFDDEPVDDAEPTVPIVLASPTPAPLRETRGASRAEVRSELPLADEPAGRELRRPGSVDLVEETEAWGDRVRPISRGGEAVEPIVLDDFEVEPADDPVIGPELAAARTRLALTVDQLADRTRIRPHVIESIEVDDFAPCGGDFYARGHLRTLARVLGQDAEPLLATYDQRYADAPINPRRVFEAELASGTGGSIRMARGGPNWSVLVAAVMAVVLAWSVARLVMDTPVELQSPAPVLNGSNGPSNNAPLAVQPVTVKLTGVEAGSHVEVRDADGEVVFSAHVATGDVHRIQATPPVTVHARDAGSVRVAVDGTDKGPLGEAGTSHERTFRVAD